MSDNKKSQTFPQPGTLCQTVRTIQPVLFPAGSIQQFDVESSPHRRSGILVVTSLTLTPVGVLVRVEQPGYPESFLLPFASIAYVTEGK